MEALPVPNLEASTVTNRLVVEVFLWFSPLKQLHSDQGHQFKSNLIMEVCKLLHINKTRTTPYHPQCDGLVEHFNRTLLNMLATCAEDHPGDWEQHIRKLCMVYNTSIQSSTGFSPFYLMFGWQARLPIDLIYGIGPQLVENQSVGEYATSLKNRISAAFDLVQTKMYHNTMCTKRNSMIRRCMGNHSIQEIGCGCTHLWLAEVVAVNLIAHGRDFTLWWKRILMQHIEFNIYRDKKVVRLSSSKDSNPVPRTSA